MRFQLYEIYLVRIEYRLCQDIRPCVVIAPPSKDLIKVARISSALDLFNSGLDFWIDSSTPDFSQTGLKKTSYISGGKFFEVHISEFGKKLGILTEELEKSFEKWLG